MARRRTRKGGAGIRGVENVIRNLNAQLVKKRAASMQGMILAAAFIRRDMEMVPPLIPVDTGNLRASWYATPGRAMGRPFVKMGFTADYAVRVHEMVGRINWKRPGSGPKFFESALRRNKAKILLILQKGMIV